MHVRGTKIGPAAPQGGTLPGTTTERLRPFPDMPAWSPTAQTPPPGVPGPGLLRPAQEKAQ